MDAALAREEDGIGYYTMSKLVLFLADGTTLDIPLDRERMTVGRRTGNDLCLPYPAVSGKHAVVVTLPTGSVLEDLGSTNGTFVNGKRVSKYFLHDRDSIDIGRQKLMYFSDNDAVVPVSTLRAARVPEASPGNGPRAVVRPTLGSAIVDAIAAKPGDIAVNTNITVKLAADELAAATAAYAAELAEQAVDDLAVPPEGPFVRVLNGPSAGRMVPLSQDETLVGRSGVQVVEVRRSGDGFRLLLVEGAEPPSVNGVAISDDGMNLNGGDVAEIAGVRVEFVNLDQAAS